MLDAAFWSKPERYATLSRLALMDRVRAAAETARSLKTRSTREASAPANRRASLSRASPCKSYLVGEGIEDVATARRSRWCWRSSRPSKSPARPRLRSPGAGGCSTCTAAGPPSGACSSPRLRPTLPTRRAAHAAGQRLWRASHTRARNRPARARALRRRQVGEPRHRPRPRRGGAAGGAIEGETQAGPEGGAERRITV